MRRVERNRPLIAVDGSSLGTAEEQLRLRISQIVISQINAHLMAAIDGYVASRIPALLEEHSRAQIDQAGLVRRDENQSSLEACQRSLAGRFDVQALDRAMDEMVRRRVAELFGVATSSVPEPSRPLDLSGVPVMTEEEALRAANPVVHDPRLGDLAGGIDPEDD